MENINKNWKVEKIEWARLTGIRPRPAGCNARLGVHGCEIPIDIVRITIGGLQGFGWSRITKESAERIIGLTVGDLFTDGGRVKENYYSVEFPLLDWIGQATTMPVYEIISGLKTSNYSVPCYDTSLYFDDLHLESDQEAVKLMQSHALEGFRKGHRHFKIKVGRGAMHMPLEEGKNRDIAIIKGVREAVGPDAKIMIDANNGYNLNLTKEVLAATADTKLTWIEEPFHEDPEYLKDLKLWLDKQNLNIMVVDGEGDASPYLVDWAKEGLIDAIQYDIRSYGFHKWLELGAELDQCKIKTAPHNYGGSFGNFALGHLAPNINGFLFIEWDEMNIHGIDDTAYRVRAGKVSIPNLPGFGLKLDDPYFLKVVESEGWSVKMNTKKTLSK